MNLLTTGVDTNYGYRLSKPVHQLAPEVITELSCAIASTAVDHSLRQYCFYGIC
jgi:hypothetical protein